MFFLLKERNTYRELGRKDAHFPHRTPKVSVISGLGVSEGLRSAHTWATNGPQPSVLMPRPGVYGLLSRMLVAFCHGAKVLVPGRAGPQATGQ